MCAVRLLYQKVNAIQHSVHDGTDSSQYSDGTVSRGQYMSLSFVVVDVCCDNERDVPFGARTQNGAKNKIPFSQPIGHIVCEIGIFHQFFFFSKKKTTTKK